MDVRGWPRALVFALAWTAALFLVLPGLVTVPVAFNDSRFVALPDGPWSLRHFETLLTSAGWAASLGHSLTVALGTAALATALGVACAVGLWRVRPWLAVAAGALMLAPLIFPPIVTALALYRAWVPLGLYDTWLGVLLAHTIVALPYVIIPVTTALTLLDPRLEQAARSLGATPWQSTRDVIVPNVKVGVATGAVFAFVISWDEIVVTMFVSNRAVYTLPRRMWDGIRDAVDPTVAAVSALLLGLTVLGVAIGLVVASLRAPRGTP